MTRYYSTERPISIGTYSHRKQVECIVNFDNGKTYCPEIKRSAWGYIEYTEPLDEQDAADYELVKAGERIYC